MEIEGRGEELEKILEQLDELYNQPMPEINIPESIGKQPGISPFESKQLKKDTDRLVKQMESKQKQKELEKSERIAERFKKQTKQPELPKIRSRQIKPKLGLPIHIKIKPKLGGGQRYIEEIEYS